MLKITAKNETGNVTTLFFQETDIKQIIVHRGKEMVKNEAEEEVEIDNNFAQIILNSFVEHKVPFETKNQNGKTVTKEKIEKVSDYVRVLDPDQIDYIYNWADEKSK